MIIYGNQIYCTIFAAELGLHIFIIVLFNILLSRSFTINILLDSQFSNYLNKK